MKYIIDLDKLQHESDICELEYYCQRYGTPLSEELEKIKAEFKDREGNDFTAFHFYEVLDNHIKELKGENNEQI